ncbi:MAG TPA: substrate-binding domain-containing protein [Pseudonocardiaceae bacterium]|nr:substrate-binding domain-containing protein [Pseudonocardiaceae bacterium]
MAPVTVALLRALAGCGGGGDGFDDSELVIYSGRQEALVGPLLERFEQQTGIATSVRYNNTPQLAAQLLEEGERTPADAFFSQDGGALGALSRAGRLERLPQAVLAHCPSPLPGRRRELDRHLRAGPGHRLPPAAGR